MKSKNQDITAKEVFPGFCVFYLSTVAAIATKLGVRGSITYPSLRNRGKKIKNEATTKAGTSFFILVKLETFHYQPNI